MTRSRTYAPSRRFDTEEPGMLGPWDGKKRPALPASAKPKRQCQPFGGLSHEEFERLSPEAKMALANHQGTNNR